ncbi:MAG: YcgN family cysteine cluster protein [Granulosicoccaceae bacterium]
MSSEPFWLKKSLDDLSDAEWESLCDGCGRCCMQKLQDADEGDVYFTDVACRLLDRDSCQCSDYGNRFKRVEDCVSLRPLDEQKISWLPPSCAYRRLALGQGLASWHPLVSGDPQTIVTAGISMDGRCRAENEVPVHELPAHIIEWQDL